MLSVLFYLAQKLAIDKIEILVYNKINIWACGKCPRLCGFREKPVGERFCGNRGIPNHRQPRQEMVAVFRVKDKRVKSSGGTVN